MKIERLHRYLAFRREKANSNFTYKFKKSNENEDLPLGGIGDLVPGFRSTVDRWERCSIQLHGPWKLDSIGMNNVSYKGKHGNASMSKKEERAVTRDESEASKRLL
jgi:hypothetical protein